MKKIYIFRPSSLGDFCLVLPILSKIKKDYSPCEIIYISEEHNNSMAVQPADLKNVVPFINDYFTYSVKSNFIQKYKIFKKIFCNPNSKFKKSEFFYLSYKKSISAFFLDYMFFNLFLNIKLHGFLTYFFYCIKVKIINNNFDSEFNRLSKQAFPNFAGEYELPGLLYDQDFFKLINKSKVNGRHNCVIFPFGKLQSKIWPLQKYVELISLLLDRNFLISIIGNSHDALSLDTLNITFGNKISIYKELDFMKLNALLKASEIYIGSDSGPMHLASILGVRCCGIFSDRDRDADWTPYGSGHSVIRSKIKCGGCMLKVCYEDPPPCLHSISSNSVLDSVLRLIDHEPV